MWERSQKNNCVYRSHYRGEEELRNRLEISGREGFYKELLVSNIS